MFSPCDDHYDQRDVPYPGEGTRTIRSLARPDAREIPIIAMTANAFDDDVQLSLQSGMNAHLNKPVETDQLFRVLDELIHGAKPES